jgi:UDP-N-acetylmuramoylalanine--D-glutamate ligase
MADKRYIVILGAGESGVGAALLAQKEGYAVFVSDFGPIADHYKKDLESAAISFEENGHSEERILTASEVVDRKSVV